MKKVVKFGGSSLADAGQFKKVGDIIRADEHRVFVVPSAPGKRNSKDTKVTDMLIGTYNDAAAGKDVKEKCTTGCIGCGICAKQCEAGAVTVENNIAHIDYEKCTGCGKCAEKCPQKIIHLM